MLCSAVTCLRIKAFSRANCVGIWTGVVEWNQGLQRKIRKETFESQQKQKHCLCFLQNPKSAALKTKLNLPQNAEKYEHWEVTDTHRSALVYLLWVNGLCKFPETSVSGKSVSNVPQENSKLTQGILLFLLQHPYFFLLWLLRLSWWCYRQDFQWPMNFN